ncbi:CocE/NonD family hydrolase [[Clostridium] symbiosum]|uniref:CocE/NonD family hydrolase n=1 Tax=Clostridium symbiosum TaxID=1512 RepID=UPI001D069F90|nr:CocE/NonD family hydrolase [[Clostridium] symbiosum]MCB6608643.1 CocE/NonD family hydrolase [[Clostridium] symbiosum]MCB6931665.1 CocE/NonD family hydrolase [[Clostridium] symbiosum]
MNTTSYNVISDPLLQSVVQDGMRIDWDVPVVMPDGVTLRADVFRPNDGGRYPALLTYGPYGKNLHMKDGFEASWNILKQNYPEIFEGTTGKYMCWETADPEKWVPDGYAIVRIDSRGAGRSEGYLACASPQEIQDFYDCIEFFAEQPWCNGNIGLAGISYFAVNQWQVASLNPPHLKAICPFEGNTDAFRDNLRHGGIFSDFRAMWYPGQVLRQQHGLGVKGPVSSMNGVLVNGPETLSEEELLQNRADPSLDPRSIEVLNPQFEQKLTALEKITVPVLSCGNWGGNGLHLRGNVEGYNRVSSKQKWLELHGREHFTEFYTDYGVCLQKRFFNYFLKGEGNWPDEQSPVYLRIKHVDGSFTDRAEQEFPLARTNWTKFYLDTVNGSFETSLQTEGSAAYKADSSSLSFFTAPLRKDVEITGPAAAKLFISSTTQDADIFMIFRVLDPEGNDVTTISASDQEGNLGTGWLRASHRKLDTEKSKFYRPWHTHHEKEMLTPNEVYELDVEIWPLCMTVPAGYRFGFTISGRDFSLPIAADHTSNGDWNVDVKVDKARGHSIYTHSIEYAQYDPDGLYSGNTTVYSDQEHASYVLLPVID